MITLNLQTVIFKISVEWGGGRQEYLLPGKWYQPERFRYYVRNSSEAGGGTTWWHVVPNDEKGDRVPTYIDTAWLASRWRIIFSTNGVSGFCLCHF